MALDKRNLVRIASAPLETNQQRALFLAATNEAASAVKTAGFFNNCRDALKVGDIAIVLADADGTAAIQIHRMTAVPTSGNVTSAATTLEVDA